MPFDALTGGGDTALASLAKPASRSVIVATLTLTRISFASNSAPARRC